MTKIKTFYLRVKHNLEYIYLYVCLSSYTASPLVSNIGSTCAFGLWKICNLRICLQFLACTSKGFHTKSWTKEIKQHSVLSDSVISSIIVISKYYAYQRRNRFPHAYQKLKKKCKKSLSNHFSLSWSFRPPPCLNCHISQVRRNFENILIAGFCH